jgi:hypothetical protein
MRGAPDSFFAIPHKLFILDLHVLLFADALVWLVGVWRWTLDWARAEAVAALGRWDG